ncbi:hypothetical protein WN944_022403 [Citrus x changshan-huyou]|uniref:Uncharacterized protein n=1 Tax=Citrus x changshan-huyou TaxID=2935761 RepID=A0AAP0R366_9ROSI
MGISSLLNIHHIFAVKPAQPANGTFLASKPLKLDPKEFPTSALCREESKPKQSKDDHLQKDMEDFLFKFPGDGFQLNRVVIQEIVVDMICKSMSKLIDHSAETLGKKTKFHGKSSEKVCIIDTTRPESPQLGNREFHQSTGGKTVTLGAYGWSEIEEGVVGNKIQPVVSPKPAKIPAEQSETVTGFMLRSPVFRLVFGEEDGKGTTAGF